MGIDVDNKKDSEVEIITKDSKAGILLELEEELRREYEEENE